MSRSNSILYLITYIFYLKKRGYFMAKPEHELTPMKRQYNAIKEQNQDCILFFRLGDF